MMPFFDGSGVSGDGLRRMYAGGHFVYPVIDVWGWVREQINGVASVS